MWWLLDLMWIVVGVVAWKCPGGGGARILLSGAIFGFLVATVNVVDTVRVNLTGKELIDYGSPAAFAIYTAGWLFAVFTVLTGVLLTLLQVRSLKRRCDELELVLAQRNAAMD